MHPEEALDVQSIANGTWHVMVLRDRDHERSTPPSNLVTGSPRPQGDLNPIYRQRVSKNAIYRPKNGPVAKHPHGAALGDAHSA